MHMHIISMLWMAFMTGRPGWLMNLYDRCGWISTQARGRFITHKKPCQHELPLYCLRAATVRL